MTIIAMPAREFIRRETRVSVAINAVLSSLFYALIFGRLDPVPAWGMGQWVFDFGPQGFMVALMSVLIPGTLAARKLRAGILEPTDDGSRLPASLAARALLMALFCAAAGTGFVAALAGLSGIDTFPLVAALPVKVAYGAALAAIVTPFGLRVAMARRVED